jgi:polyhydroxyalkanoate synthesis regulator phasin
VGHRNAHTRRGANGLSVAGVAATEDGARAHGHFLLGSHSLLRMEREPLDRGRFSHKLVGPLEYLDRLARGKGTWVSPELLGGLVIAVLGATASITGVILTWRSKTKELSQSEGGQLRKELREENVSLKTENKEHKETIEALENEVEELQKLGEKKDRQIEELSRLNEELVKQNKDLLTDRALMKREIENLRGDVLRLTREVTALKGK